MIDKTEEQIQESITQLNDSLIRVKKQELRHRALSQRNAIEPESTEAMAAAEGVMNLVLDNLPLEPDTIIAGYWPTGNELDLRPTMTFLSQTHRVCLPQVLDEKETLIFRQWTPHSPLTPGTFNIMEPRETAPLVPDICLIPLLAFDRQGHRLGYGIGCYDKYLNQRESQGHHVMKVGIAFTEQEITHIPTELTDKTLDWIITPQEIIVVNPTAHGAHQP